MLFRSYWRILQVCLFFIALLSGEVDVCAQSSREYDLKAAFLFNFAQFVEWPANAFADAQSPLIIGVVGANPFHRSLDEIVRGELVRGRKIEVRYLSPGPAMEQCHILFIAQNESGRFPEILRSTRGKPILLVSDIDQFAHQGGMIAFTTEQNKVRFNINLEAAKEAHLNLSSKLLRLGRLVTSE